MDKKNYSMGIKCRNCGYYDYISIPKGTSVKDIPCENCGCKELERK